MLCVFHKEFTSEWQATYRRCFSIPVEWMLLLLGSTNEGIVVRCPPIFTVAFHQVHRSPIFTVAPHQVHHSPISSVTPSTRVAPISTVVPSTSVAPIVTVAFLQLHHSAVLLLLLATISCHVIMLLDNSILSTILLLMWIRLVDYLPASLKYKFLQLQNM